MKPYLVAMLMNRVEFDQMLLFVRLNYTCLSNDFNGSIGSAHFIPSRGSLRYNPVRVRGILAAGSFHFEESRSDILRLREWNLWLVMLAVMLGPRTVSNSFAEQSTPCLVMNRKNLP